MMFCVLQVGTDQIVLQCQRQRRAVFRVGQKFCVRKSVTNTGSYEKPSGSDRRDDA